MIPLAVGDRVTLWDGHTASCAVVWCIDHKGFMTWWPGRPAPPVFTATGRNLLAEEGTTWVRGWDTPEALAMLAASALVAAS